MFILLKPTDACNINCLYCSVGDSRYAPFKFMSSEEAILMIDRIFEYAIQHKWEDFVLCFHGGEPLLAGIKFYEKVLDFVRSKQPKDCKVGISIQSNLTLFNESFLSLFRQYSVQVSTSLDGPPELHDRMRSYTNGKGTSRKIINALNSFKKYNIQVGVICTVNRLNLGSEDAIFAFFKGLEQDFKANHVHNIGSAAINHLGINPDEIARSRMRFFDLWFFDPEPTIRERNTFEIVVSLLTGKPSVCIFQECCQDSILTVEFDGSVTACDAIKNVGLQNSEICYGNLLHQSLNEIMSSDGRKRFLKRRPPFLNECVNCKYLSVCNGGCMLDAIAEYGDLMHKTPICSGYQQVFGYIEEVLERASIKKSPTESYILSSQT